MRAGGCNCSFIREQCILNFCLSCSQYSSLFTPQNIRIINTDENRDRSDILVRNFHKFLSRVSIGRVH